MLWYACLENYIKPNSLTQSSRSIWHIPTYCQDLKFLNGLKALKNPKSKTRHFFLFCQSIWFQLWNHEKKVPKAFNFGDKIGQIYIKRARSRCKKSKIPYQNGWSSLYLWFWPIWIVRKSTPKQTRRCSCSCPPQGPTNLKKVETKTKTSDYVIKVRQKCQDADVPDQPQHWPEEGNGQDEKGGKAW